MCGQSTGPLRNGVGDGVKYGVVCLARGESGEGGRLVSGGAGSGADFGRGFFVYVIDAVFNAGDVVQIVSGNGKFAVKRTAVGDQLISSAETVVKGKIQCCAVIDHPVGNGRGPGFYGKLRSPGKSGRAVAGNAAVKRKIAGNIERAQIMNVVQAAVCFVAAENGVAYFQRGVRGIINRAAESFACCRSCAVAAENGVVAEGDHAFAVKRAAQCFGRVGFDTVVGKAAV